MNDELTATIASLVRERWPGARLVDTVHLAGDFSSRRYLRATLAGGDAPATMVVMVLAGSGLPLSSEELGVFPEPLTELPFVDVHRLLTAIGAPVPAIYVAAVDQGLLLLEDAGDTVLWDAANGEPATAEACYRRAIDALLIMH
jgi:aminoglycoside/choline kinase family phosphotransferase